MRNAIILITIAAASCFADTTYVSGAVSGVWDTSGSPYVITDSTWVVRRDSLRIGPGVEVLFDGPHGILVDSALFKAIGNETDSIVFTAIDTMIGFKGIEFYFHSIGKCTLAYCQFSYMKAKYSWLAPITGGDVDVLHCCFTRNTVDSLRGNPSCLAYCDNIEHCVFENNDLFYWMDVLYGRIDSCVFIENGSGMAAMGCNVSNSQFYGCGVSSGMGYVSVANCYIDADSTGTCFSGGESCILQNCVLKGGTCVELSSSYRPPIFINCDFTAANRYFLSSVSSVALVFNSILHSSNDSISEPFRSGTIFSHCLVDSSLFWAYPLADSIIWDNIFYEDPLFVDFAGGDYHLTGDSPCIDYGGDSFYIPSWDTVIYAPETDIEGTPRPIGDGIDIGAYEYPNDVGIIEMKRPTSLSLTAYPNPFNSAITIVFDYESESCRRRVEQVGCGPAAGVGASDARSGQVGVQIFDMNGHLVADLPVTNCGSPQFVPTPQVWQPEKSLGSGVYLVRARAGGASITKRVVYLR